jgi:hypothetical protein
LVFEKTGEFIGLDFKMKSEVTACFKVCELITQ